jgi:RNA polymerase sigma factor (sigma-70 family)
MNGSVMRSMVHEYAGIDEASLTELVVSARNGDRRATADLLRLIAPAVARAGRAVLGAKHADLDDVIQQTFIAFVRALESFRGDCHPAGFAARIAVHTAISARRRTNAQRVRIRALASLASPDDPGSLADTPDLAVRRRQLVRSLLAQLPDDQSETLALHVVLGHSLEEIAEAMFCPVNTVKSRLRLAKQALRRHIENDPLLWSDPDLVSP